MIEDYKRFEPFKMFPKVNHINLYGGARDTIVSEKFTTNLIVQNSLLENTDHLKNLYMTVDHNSPYFYKHFLDAFVPKVVSSFIRH